MVDLNSTQERETLLAVSLESGDVKILLYSVLAVLESLEYFDASRALAALVKPAVLKGGGGRIAT